ncbi:hypothetical protein D3C78_1261800 [compost metagenome]
MHLGEIADGQVQPLLQQQTLHFTRHGADQFDAHGLVPLTEAPDRLGHPLQHRLIQGFGQAQAHFADQAPGHAVGLMTEGFDGLEQSTGCAEQLFSLGRDPEPSLAATA